MKEKIKNYLLRAWRFLKTYKRQIIITSMIVGVIITSIMAKNFWSTTGHALALLLYYEILEIKGIVHFGDDD
jgi:Sec-independent protein secretion pathway component TatC